jgi:hypothetical protein
MFFMNEFTFQTHEAKQPRQAAGKQPRGCMLMRDQLAIIAERLAGNGGAPDVDSRVNLVPVRAGANVHAQIHKIPTKLDNSQRGWRFVTFWAAISG